MRVTIEHREESAGVTRRKRNYFLDCKVELSEEERAIVKARGLQDQSFPIDAATPDVSNAAFIGTGFIRGVGGLLIGGGIMLIYFVFFTSWAGPLMGWMIFIGIALSAYGWIRENRQEWRDNRPKQQIKLGRLMSRPAFTVYSPDPSYAKHLEEEIRTHLAAMKQLLAESAEIKAKQTFEL